MPTATTVAAFRHWSRARLVTTVTMATGLPTILLAPSMMTWLRYTSHLCRLCAPVVPCHVGPYDDNNEEDSNRCSDPTTRVATTRHFYSIFFLFLSGKAASKT
ncbi:hypothetical protein EDB87DRAFT_88969 [Lactarius vividus]|nr:hypothetical protein EDB87DRAFT_88969 [Lactarius vividus]